MYRPSFAPTQPMALFEAPEVRRSVPLSAREIAAALYASRFALVACTVVFGLLAAGLYALQSPVHTAVARVFVQTEQLGAPSFLSGITPYRESQIPEAANRRLETEIALLTSRSNAAEVVSSLGITRSQLPGTPLAAAMRWSSDHTPEALKQFVAHVLGKPRKPARSDAATAEDLLAGISVEPMRSKAADTTSNVLEIKLKSSDPTLSTHALEALLAAYLRSSGQQGQRLGEATIALLEKQVATAAEELERIERSVLRLAEGKSRRAAGELPGLITGTESALPAATVGREGSRAANDTVVTQLATQVVDLQAKYDEQRMSLTDEAPAVRALHDRLTAARSRLSSSVRNSASDNLDFTRLERQRSLLQDRYLELRRKRDQISLFTHLNPSALDGRAVIDAPSVPDEIGSGASKMLLVIGPVAGLMLGLLLAGVRELTDRRLRTRADVERALGLPMLGELPVLDRTRMRALLAATLSPGELNTREFT